jgi:hypothetical protein
MRTIYADEKMSGSLMVNGSPPPVEFTQPPTIEAKLVCLPQGTGGSQCTATRTDLFLAAAPLHGFSRVPYNTNAAANPGAWTLVTQPLAAEDAQRIVQPPLIDDAKPPTPTECVLNIANPLEGTAVRLYLPIPPHYPDEVRARLWAQGTRYRMAPPSICPVGTTSSYASGSSSSPGESGDAAAPPPPAGSSYHITSPTAGQAVSGLVQIMGTAQFDPAQVQYYKLEIGNGRSPTAWTTFGTTHNQPIANGTLEQLHADALPAGDYVIRLILVGNDGNFVGSPHSAPITIK